MNKLGLHIIGGWRGNLGRPRVVKLVNVSVEYVAQVRGEVGPECLIIVRDEWDEPNLDAADVRAEARAWYARRRPGYLAMRQAAGPNVAFETGVNECPGHLLDRYVPFSLELIPLMHADGLRVVAGNPSVGCWNERNWLKFKPVLDILRPGDFLGVHEYWSDQGDIANRWHCARWTIAEIAAVIGSTPIVVTECGRDYTPDTDKGQSGWRRTCDEATFLEDLRRYNALLEGFPNVIGATVFSAGEGWEMFDPTPIWPQVVAGYSSPQTYPQPGGTTPPQEEAPMLNFPSSVTAPGVTYKTASTGRPFWQSERNPTLYTVNGALRLWLVLHDTEGPRDAAFAWWSDPSNPYQSSAHDLIDAAGVVWRCVPYKARAHHVGYSVIPGYNSIPSPGAHPAPNANDVAIGVELEYPVAPASPAWPAAQIAAAKAHCRELVRVFGIPRERVLRHSEIDTRGKTDPRNFDWAGFLARLYEQEHKPITLREQYKVAWAAAGHAFVDGNAFPEYALSHRLGVPQGHEFDFAESGRTWKAQAFGKCLIACPLGDWGSIEERLW